MTNNIKKRIKAHMNKKARCKYTRRKDKHPLKLSLYYRVDGRGNAIKLEKFIKSKGHKFKKDLLINREILLDLYNDVYIDENIDEIINKINEK